MTKLWWFTVGLALLLLPAQVLAVPDPSQVAPFMDKTLMTPRNVEATYDASADAVTLTWLPPSGNAATVYTYQVRRDGLLLGTTNQESFTDTQPLNVSIIVYQITANSASGSGAPATYFFGGPAFLNGDPLLPQGPLIHYTVSWWGCEPIGVGFSPSFAYVVRINDNCVYHILPP